MYKLTVSEKEKGNVLQQKYIPYSLLTHEQNNKITEILRVHEFTYQYFLEEVLALF